MDRIQVVVQHVTTVKMVLKLVMKKKIVGMSMQTYSC